MTKKKVPTEHDIYLENRKDVERDINLEQERFTFQGEYVSVYTNNISLQEFYERATTYFKEIYELSPSKVFLNIDSGYDDYDFEAKFSTPETKREYDFRLEKEEKARLKAEADKIKRHEKYLELKKEFEQ